jgi:hypothetical protein
MNQQPIVPLTESKVQSPYLYLQAAGSTGLDGSTYGAHVRWQFLRNLETHLAKGNNARTTLNFNRPDDFLTLSRSRYVTRFPTIVDFSAPPNIVNDALAFWIYTATNTSTVIYIHFRDAMRYAEVRDMIDPLDGPQEFIQQYCPALLEVELKDKLFFAAEFDVARDAATVMRTEALSVEENVPLSDLFVSCRKVFTDDNWCVSPHQSELTAVPACCDGPNLLDNGGFEHSGAFFTENFDGVIAPALPAGWTAANDSGLGPLWVTSVTNPDTAPNDAFVGAPAISTDNYLETPNITIPSAAAQIRFRNNFNFEHDPPHAGTFGPGGVLEVSSPNINGGAFVDVTDPSIGGTFVSGGYTGEIDGTANNPLAGRMAWRGNSGGYIDTVANLGPNVNGQTIKLRFRMGTDETGDAPGWRIDTTSIVAESAPIELGFETDYEFQTGLGAGIINIVSDPSSVNHVWEGLPHGGEFFLAVDGSKREGDAVLRFTRVVDLETDYCFTGWLATLWKQDVSIPLQFRFTDAGGASQSFEQRTPATVGTWEEFAFTWNSGTSGVVTVEIISLSVVSIGNDFGLDDLWFCKKRGCRARIGAENIRSVRFDVNGGYPRRLELETYDDYIAGAPWETLDRLALTTTPAQGLDGMVLEISINGGAFAGIIHAGGNFTTGGYTHAISGAFGSPIAGQMAWSGLSAGTPAAPAYVTTAVQLPAAAHGQSIRLKWRVATGSSADIAGVRSVRLDSVSIRPDIVIAPLTFSQNFDGVTAPALPAGWTTAATGSGVGWMTSKAAPASAPNDVFAPALNGIGVTELVTPPINVPAGGGTLTFQNLFNLELITMRDETAFARLEPAPNTVNGHWQKYNDNALLNVSNYETRWTLPGGLGYGVRRYIELSDTDPMASDTWPGDTQPEEGTIEISLLDTLRIVSFDFHVARMLGQGYLDRDIAQDTDEYIYLGVYDTQGALDDTHIARPVRHQYMGVPTKPLDYRLPDTPTLKPVTYGLTVDSGELPPASLTDPQGYTPDGVSRYVNLFVEPEDESEELDDFFVPPIEFCSIDKTSSVFYGIEYRAQGESGWEKPEIASDANFKDLDVPAQFETLPLPNNADLEDPVLRHEERHNGVHEYGGYGINWFSRATSVGNIVATDDTLIKKTHRLLPPANLGVQLIQKESPLMLTTRTEQEMLEQLELLPGPDRTLVRVRFDYFHGHDINYGFADTVHLFFRRDMPRNVVGAVKSVSDDPADTHKAIIRTTGFIVNSQGTTIAPALDSDLFGNFVGGMFSCQQENYIVTDVSTSTLPDEGPIFTVQKNVQGNAADPGTTGTLVTVQEYISPNLGLSEGQLMFMAVENMADPGSWGTDPLSKIVKLGDPSWTTHTETYVQDGETITVILRGIWDQATIAHTPTPEVSGVYTITFATYTLPPHQQHLDADPVDWCKGAVRVDRAGDPNGPKKVLEVLLIDLDENQHLVLHVLDNAYDALDPNDLIVTGTPVTVNYYPGYKVYLHADPLRDFTEAAILPAEGEGNRKTWLGARSCDSVQLFHSPIGIPAPVIALEFVEPKLPKEPQGGEFATWPDFYYKASYTFKLDFAAGHKPFSVVLYRTNDEAILRTLYNDDIYKAVRQHLESLGDDDPYLSDRWKNLVGFDYDYGDPATNGMFKTFPDGYGFPNPNKSPALTGRPGDILPALKEAIQGAFTPLTEMPLLFDLIKGPEYEPVPKPQNIRNEQGTLLDPGDPKFDIAPMAKRTGNGFEIQFTDFTLDGTSNNIFFYCSREIGNLGRLGEPGGIAGPVQLINTRPPDQPGVKKMYVRELDLLNNTGPAVTFEVNAYPDVQKIRRMLVYRTTDAGDALSVRAMQLVKTVDLVTTNQIGQPSVLLSDDFESGFVPYGDPLFYRLVALRQVKNPHGGTDWAPSQPSKVLLTAVPDTINPEAPEITLTYLSGSPAELTGVSLSWPTTVHNGTYYLDKINAVGNWVTIYQSKTNITPVTVNLAATDLGTDVLPKQDADEDRPIYHRFRVRVENSSGLFSLIDKVLVI